MSHESVIASLKKLLKRNLMDVAPEAQIDYMLRESDRTTLILLAATVEDMLLRALVEMMPSLNNDERERIFNFEGPCGSFSNRIRIAQGLGIIDRPMRKRIELIKELRNVAAHSHAEIHYSTPEIAAAVACIFGSKNEIISWENNRIRAAYLSLCVALAAELAGNEKVDIEEYFIWIRQQQVRPFPDK